MKLFKLCSIKNSEFVLFLITVLGITANNLLR